MVGHVLAVIEAAEGAAHRARLAQHAHGPVQKAGEVGAAAVGFGDGAGEVRTFVDIVFPMIKPGVGALAIFTFINAWNDYFLQLIMLNSQSKLSISLGIAKMQAEASTDFGLIMAGATLASVPIITIFLIFQKYFTKGITLGAVKG